MWQRFTERARKVIFYAQEEAQKWRTQFVCTEHLLLGLCRDKDTVAMRILAALKIDPKDVVTETDRLLVKGDASGAADMTLAPAAKQVIDCAYDEARNLNNSYIGTEHLLLALIGDENGIAGRVFKHLGASLSAARKVTIEFQDNEARAQTAQRVQGTHKSQAFTELRVHISDSSRVMASLLLIRQQRSCAEFLALSVLSADVASTKVLFDLLKVDYLLLLGELESDINNALAHTSVEPASDIAPIYAMAMEEALQASQPLSPMHFVPALLRHEDNRVAACLKSRDVSLEDVRKSLKEVPI